MPQDGYGWAGSAADYHLTGDPFMDRSGSGDPFFPRLYCVGVANSGALNTPPSGIALWTSTDGRSWSNPIPITSSDTSTPSYDKPSIVVSRASVSYGYIYVSYDKWFSTTPGQQEIHISLSTNGGSSFPQDNCVNDGAGNCLRGNIGRSAIVVDKNGYVYVFWLDFTNNQVYREYSLNSGATWSAPDLVANGTRFLGFNNLLYQGLRAPSTLSASYDSYLHRLAVVWHQRKDTQFTSPWPTDAWIATKGAGEAWDVRQLTIPPTGNDQFMPSVASDLGGGFLATYYSRGSTFGDVAYRQYDIYMDGHGNPIRGIEEISLFSSIVTNPNGGLEPDTVPGFIGDYQHVTYNPALGTFQNVWIGRQTSAESSPLDEWFARVQ